MLAYLVLPIAVLGLVAALTDGTWGAALVLAAAFIGRALDGHHAVPDALVGETVLLVIAYWGITAYLRPLRAHDMRLPYLPLLGAAVGALVGVLAAGGVMFALFSVAGAMLASTIAFVADLPRVEAKYVLLEPLRVMSVMVAGYYLMFHLS